MPFKKKTRSKKRVQVSEKQSHRPRYIYQQRTRIELQCRVCLTLSNNVMYDLSNNTSFNSEDGVNDYYKHVSICEALEKVTSTKVVLKEAYPQYICPICLSFLKMALKFILQFEESQIKIDKILGIHLSESNLDAKDNERFKLLDKETEGFKNVENKNDVTPVEVIYGENKFSLSDLILVEEEEKEGNNFSGFLRNLGKEVSASFTDKSRENKVETAESTGVSITVIEKNRLLPVKELELIEETDEIKFVIEDVNDTFTTMEGEELFEVVVDDYPEDDNIVLKEHSSEQVDDSEKLDYIEMNMSNIDNFIIEHGKDSSDDKNKENSIGKIHKTKRHKKEVFDISHPCELCKKIFSSERHLKAHKRRTHSTNVMTYICDICGYKNNTLSAHNHHKTKHIGKKWVCNICKKPYYTKAVLKVHMQSHINKRQHLCNVCGKGFNYANALEYHMRLHTGEKKYECNLCSQRFRMPNSLKRHLRTHTGEKPYKCQYCAKPFFSKSEVSAHELIHTDYRPYVCSYCAKGFTKSHNMKVHLLSHSGPHRCNLCARSFIDTTILQMHYKMIHKINAVKFEESSDDQEMLDSEDIEAFIE